MHFLTLFLIIIKRQSYLQSLTPTLPRFAQRWEEKKIHVFFFSFLIIFRILLFYILSSHIFKKLSISQDSIFFKFMNIIICVYSNISVYPLNIIRLRLRGCSVATLPRSYLTYHLALTSYININNVVIFPKPMETNISSDR